MRAQRTVPNEDTGGADDDSYAVIDLDDLAFLDAAVVADRGGTTDAAPWEDETWEARAERRRTTAPAYPLPGIGRRHRYRLRVPGALAIVLVAAAVAMVSSSCAVLAPFAYYAPGAPVMTELWVNAASGNDNASGADRSHALRSLGAAWNRIPTSTAGSSTGYRIQITAGVLPMHTIPNNWYEGKHGTAAKPIIFSAVDGNGTVTIQGGMNVFDVSYLYLYGVRLEPAPPCPANNPGCDRVASDSTFHGDTIDHFLLKNSVVVGRATSLTEKETVKVNQSSYIYLEDNDISGAWDNPVDFVAVQHAHAINNKIHDGDDWCMYTKGGSFDIRVDANELYDCTGGGFTAGQGTGFEWMVSPWLHYEAYGIEATNNVIHDIYSAGLGVNGGYNVLFAYNTLYRVGARSHLIEVVHGGHSCDGDATRCSANKAAGGWGPTAPGGLDDIPDKHVAIVDNIVYNPAGYETQWQHFQIDNPITQYAGSNTPSPSRADDDLLIAGNVIWNGSSSMSLGISFGSTCTNANPTCSEAQLLRDNKINTVEPVLVNPAGGDYRLAGALPITTVALPPIIWSDAPTQPNTRTVPGTRSANASHTKAGTGRSLPGAPGAF